MAQEQAQERQTKYGKLHIDGEKITLEVEKIPGLVWYSVSHFMDFVATEKVTHLNVSHNDLGPIGISFLAEALKQNHTLISLNLSHMDIGEEGIQALAKALEGYPTLKELILNSNSISNAGAIALASGLEKNTVLTALCLNHNNIESAGVEAIAAALVNHPSLQLLDLSSNWVGDEAAKTLAHALQNNTVLENLDLSGNQIGDAGASALAQLFPGNTTLTTLLLQYNKIGNGGAIAFAEILSNNAALKKLGLGGNIKGKGFQALGSALRQNTVLRVLDLYGNTMPNVDNTIFLRALECNTTLTSYACDYHDTDSWKLIAIKECEDRNMLLAAMPAEKAAEERSLLALGITTPLSYFCPISFTRMKDPVCTPAGESYERAAIEERLSGPGRKKYTKAQLIPNRALGTAIADFVKTLPAQIEKKKKVREIQDTLHAQFLVLQEKKRQIEIHASALQASAEKKEAIEKTLHAVYQCIKETLTAVMHLSPEESTARFLELQQKIQDYFAQHFSSSAPQDEKEEEKEEEERSDYNMRLQRKRQERLLQSEFKRFLKHIEQEKYAEALESMQKNPVLAFAECTTDKYAEFTTDNKIPEEQILEALGIHIPEGFLCPIEYTLLHWPILLPSGNAAERTAMGKCVPRKDPFSKAPVGSSPPINTALKKAIAHFRLALPRSIQEAFVIQNEEPICSAQANALATCEMQLKEYVEKLTASVEREKKLEAVLAHTRSLIAELDVDVLNQVAVSQALSYQLEEIEKVLGNSQACAQAPQQEVHHPGRFGFLFQTMDLSSLQGLGINFASK